MGFPSRLGGRELADFMKETSFSRDGHTYMHACVCVRTWVSDSTGLNQAALRSMGLCTFQSTIEVL